MNYRLSINYQYFRVLNNEGGKVHSSRNCGGPVTPFEHRDPYQNLIFLVISHIYLISRSLRQSLRKQTFCSSTLSASIGINGCHRACLIFFFYCVEIPIENAPSNPYYKPSNPNINLRFSKQG